MSSQPPAGDRDEDLDFVIPTPLPSMTTRSSTLSVAAAALAIAGAFSIAGAVLIAGAGGSSTLVGFVVGFGIVQIIVAVLVYRQVPVGRPAGLAVAAVGVVFGLVRVVDGTGIALLDLVAYAFVIWALATSGEAFRRG